jgi:cell division protein FtsX
VAAGGAAAAPFAVGASTGFLGSVVTSALLALAVAGYNAYSVVAYEQPRFAAGFVAAVFGLWLVAAPLT